MLPGTRPPTALIAYGSFAKGGLANGWGANALSFDENDLADWPVSFSEMDAAYKTVYERIPVAGPIDDDLTSHLRGVYPSQPAIRLSASDQRLLNSYERRKPKLAKLGVKIGGARLAVVTDPSRADACDYSERCLWGCTKGAIYNPRLSTLKACETHRGFRYVAGRLVLALRSNANRIDGIRYLDVATNAIREESCNVVFLAAGALQSGAIFLRTLKAGHAEVAPRSEGLMDTTVVKIPFLALRCIGQTPDARSFQFNRLIAAIVSEATTWPRYLHAELLHLTSLIYHPLIERLPFDSRTSARLFFAVKPAIGVATLFFPDRITSGNHQLLVDRGGHRGDCRTSIPGIRRQGALHSALRRQDALGVAPPRLPAAGRRSLSAGRGHPLRRNGADGYGTESVRRHRSIESVCQSLHCRWRGVSVVAQQIDYDVACCARHSSRANGGALGTR